MGLKKHGSTRRKVLNLKDSSNPSKQSWQSKYQPVNASGTDEVTSVTSSNKEKSREASNPLGGLLQCYESDCSVEDESEIQINSKVKNFMEEIEKLSSDATNEKPSSAEETSTRPSDYVHAVNSAVESTESCVWQECYDENMGHPYYWNTETNEVVWEMPNVYRLHADKLAKLESSGEGASVSVVPASEATTPIIEDYPGNTSGEASAGNYDYPSTPVSKTENIAESVENKLRVPCRDDIAPQNSQEVKPKDARDQEVVQSNSSSMCYLNSNVPVNETVISSPKLRVKATTNPLALVANYGPDSDDEMDQSNCISASNLVVENKLTVPSTSLFPISIGHSDDEADYSNPEISELKRKYLEDDLEKAVSHKLPKTSLTQENQDFSDLISNKRAFQRKKRIDFATVAVGPTVKTSIPSVTPSSSFCKSEDTDESVITPRLGLGFSGGSESSVSIESKKPFNGIHFIKAETINVPDNTVVSKAGKGEYYDDSKVEDTAELIVDKLAFLLEAETSALSPVMALHLQLETLLAAWQAGALTCSYLTEKLEEAASELSKQEMSAAPAGWLCRWDRSSKRYFYQNRATKEIKMEYPDTEHVTNFGSSRMMSDCDSSVFTLSKPPVNESEKYCTSYVPMASRFKVPHTAVSSSVISPTTSIPNDIFFSSLCLSPPPPPLPPSPPPPPPPPKSPPLPPRTSRLPASVPPLPPSIPLPASVPPLPPSIPLPASAPLTPCVPPLPASSPPLPPLPSSAPLPSSCPPLPPSISLLPEDLPPLPPLPTEAPPLPPTTAPLPLSCPPLPTSNNLPSSCPPLPLSALPLPPTDAPLPATCPPLPPLPSDSPPLPPMPPPDIPPPPPLESLQWEEPLPPGVDYSEESLASNVTTNQNSEFGALAGDSIVRVGKATHSAFSAELTSFYSHLADVTPSEVTDSKLSDTSHATIKKEAIFQKTEMSDKMTKEKNIAKETADSSIKKKKKSKISGALSLKKKGVSNLVAKWQQVRRDLTDSDDET